MTFVVSTHDASGLVDTAEADSPEAAFLAARTLNAELPIVPGRSCVQILCPNGETIVVTGADLYR